MTQNTQPNWIVVGVAALAVILGIFVLTLNWATGELGPVEFDYGLFGADAAGEESGWYDAEYDEVDGIGMIRAGMPVVLVGLVALLGGLVISAIPPAKLKMHRLLSAGELVGAGVILLVGTLLFTIGVSSYLGQAKDLFAGAFDWSVGTAMVFGYLVSVLAIAAGVVAFMMKTGPQIDLGGEAPQDA